MSATRRQWHLLKELLEAQWTPIDLPDSVPRLLIMKALHTTQPIILNTRGILVKDQQPQGGFLVEGRVIARIKEVLILCILLKITL